ncbi:MAG: hypothetical protein ACFB10_21015 [Salibacteraceae bacterium]
MRRYKLDNKKAQPLNEEEMLRHKDFKKVLTNYQKATRPLYLMPLYRNPRTFLAVLLVLVILLLLWQAVEEEREAPAPTPTEQVD